MPVKKQKKSKKIKAVVNPTPSSDGNQEPIMPVKKQKKSKKIKAVVNPTPSSDGCPISTLSSIDEEVQEENEPGYYFALVRHWLFDLNLVLRFGQQYFVGITPTDGAHSLLCSHPDTEVVSLWGYDKLVPKTPKNTEQIDAYKADIAILDEIIHTTNERLLTPTAKLTLLSKLSEQRDDLNEQVFNASRRESIWDNLPEHLSVAKFDFKKIQETPENYQPMEYTWDAFKDQILAYGHHAFMEIRTDLDILKGELNLSDRDINTPNFQPLAPALNTVAESALETKAAVKADARYKLIQKKRKEFAKTLFTAKVDKAKTKKKQVKKRK